MNHNNNNNNDNNNDNLQAVIAAALRNQQRQASFVSDSQEANNTSSDQRSGDSNSRTSSSSNSSNQRRLNQPLVDAVPNSQAANLLAGLDAATQALLIKALQMQAGGGGQPPTSSNQQSQPQQLQQQQLQGNNATMSPQQLLIQQLLQLQQQQQQQQQLQSAPNVVHAQATSQASTGMLPANLADQTGAAVPPPPLPKEVSAPSRSEQASGRTTSSLSHSAEGSSESEREKLGNNKRAAVRVSAQQSRLRKKQYVEELEVENAELRKLRQIMAVIPDAILAFDASGVIRYVTKSARAILGSSPIELKGKSFWEILTTKDARRLKSAFMDSLANREPGRDYASLGDGVWQIHLKDQLPESPGLSLHGAVHFGGSAPECVCLVRRIPTPSTATTIPNEVGSDERGSDERQSETTSDQTSSDDAYNVGGAAVAAGANSPPQSSEAVSSQETGAAASTEVKPPSVVQAADYDQENKKQGPFDTSSSMSSGSS